MNSHPSTPDAPQDQTHTPLPWHIALYVKSTDAPDALAIWPATVKDGTRGHPVALVAPLSKCSAEDEANAALIVHAVNTHAQLVAALEGMLRANDPSNWESDDSPDQTRAILKAESKAREVLALARTVGQAQG